MSSFNRVFFSVGLLFISLFAFSSYESDSRCDNEPVIVSISNPPPPPPIVNISSFGISCEQLGNATITATGGGPYSYTWLPSNQTGSVATFVAPGTYTVLIFDASDNNTYSHTTVFSSSVLPSASLVATQSLACYGEAGFASIVGLSGTTGSFNYLWTGPSGTFTSPVVHFLTAGVYTVSRVDSITHCRFDTVFTITQPPALILNLTTSSPTTCIGFPITYTASMSGGTPGYSLSLSNTGSVASTFTLNETTGGSYNYTLTGTDANACAVTNTFVSTFITFPGSGLSVSDASICPLETATLTATGATSYTWQTNSAGSTFTASPSATAVFTVIGANSTCTTATTASIIVKQLPVALILSNSPVCEGHELSLVASGGVSYLWSGSLSFTSSIKNPTLSSVSPSNSGVYDLTVTAANNCTASVSTTVIINPTPTISLNTSTACVNDTLHFAASSFSGSSFFWSGPMSFTSSQQNPAIANASINMTGSYTVLVTSANNCTNSASGYALVNPLPILSVSDVSICPLTVGELTVSGANSYIWNNNSIGNTFTASPSSNTQYTVIGSSQNCTASAVVSILLHPSPTPTIVSNSPVCETKTLALAVSGGMSYNWNGPSGFVSNDTTVFVTPVNQSHSGAYTVTVFSAHGCSASVIEPVVVNPAPEIKVYNGLAIEVCLGAQVILSASGGVNYQWISNLSPQTVPGESITVQPMSPVIYTVIGTDINGCIANSNITLSVNECLSIAENIERMNHLKVYPNPASSEITIEFEEVSDKNIRIYSITGQELISATSTEQKIKLNISELPAGVYFIHVLTNKNCGIVRFIRQ